MIEESKRVNLTIKDLIFTLENSYTGLIGGRHYLCRGTCDGDMEDIPKSCIIKWDVEGIEEPTPEMIMQKFEVLRHLRPVENYVEEPVAEVNLELPEEPSIDEIS